MKKIILYILLVLSSFASTFKISNLIIEQGDYFSISTDNDIEIIQISSEFIWTDLVPYKVEGKIYVKIPVHYANEQGYRNLIIDFKEKDETKREIYNIFIKKKEFPKSEIFVNEKMEKEGTGKNREDSINQSRKVRNSPIKNPMWKEDFIWPIKGTITTGFGYSRYINGKLTNWHNGLDIAQNKGKNIIASNEGVIVYSDYMKVTGNTIIIDHGGNVFTGYAHMNSRLVDLGKKVRRGELIGTVGSTGFSTGPHLHFTFSIGTTFVNPYLFLEN